MPRRAGRVFALAIATLITVRALSFLIVLPVVNPHFVNLMPYAATLFSRVLFGKANGGVLVRMRA
ncbi:MAG: hypothetical protein ACKVQU_04440 [Burkholderiales bacterium]